MSTKANLVNEPVSMDLGSDSIVIRQYIGGKTGGATLDTTDFKESFIKAGHLVIKTLDEDKHEVYKPMPVDGKAYKELPQKHNYAGVVVCSKPKNEPFVGIMDNGRVNDKAMPYPITDEMRTALKSALPNLIFEHD